MIIQDSHSDCLQLSIFRSCLALEVAAAAIMNG